MMVEPAKREYRTWIVDSRRWQQYRPRRGDIVIATYPKCGTTWMQRIVSLLIFQTPDAVPVMKMSPWIDRRFPQPIETVIADIDAQAHRRFVKSHLPFDGLPYYEDVQYIHVARDGRDTCMSFHNHTINFTEQMLENLDKAGLADETIARPYPRPLPEPAEHFHRWLTEGVISGDEDGSPTMSFFHFERTWWEARHLPNVLLVHYNDLKADLAQEMRRVADFLGISVSDSSWPELVKAAGFETMRRDGDVILANVASSFKHGSEGFFFKGINGRWRGEVNPDDLMLYDTKLGSMLSPACSHWVTRGRL